MYDQKPKSKLTGKPIDMTAALPDRLPALQQPDTFTVLPQKPAAALTRVTWLISEVELTHSDGARHRLLELLNALGGNTELHELARLYQAQSSRSLHNALMAAFEPWPDTRRFYTSKLTTLQVQMPWSAFVEQLAYGAAYAQQDDFSDAKGAGEHSNLAEVIQASGYRSLPLVRGRWGLQFRMFKPIPGHAAMFPHPPVPIMAFRGTEGIKPFWSDATGPDREGLIDTYIGDLTRMGAGYPQYQANKELIERNAAALGRSLMTGHSLGGGIAQIVTARLPQYASECITFAAPGVLQADADSLKGKNIPSAHHRTVGDIVPTSGDKMTPGQIVVYDRYIAAQDSEALRGDRSPLTTHNSMPVHSMLNYVAASKLLPIEQEIKNRGVAGPTKEDTALRTVSVVSGVHSTDHDPATHLGERSLSVGVTRRIFMANLGYNLAVEYAQAEVAKLDPAKMDKATILRELDALTLRITELPQLAMTKEALSLYNSLGLHDYDVFTKRPFLTTAQFVPVPDADRLEVARQVTGTWRAWWPGHAL